MSDLESVKSYIERKLKDVESNLKRFPDRSQQYHKEACDKLQTLEDSSSEAEAYKTEATALLNDWQNRLLVLGARNARRNDGSCLEYGLNFHLDRFTSAVCIFFLAWLFLLFSNFHLF